MSDAAAKSATAFDGERRLASGPLIDVAMALKAAVAAGAAGPLLAFDDATGAVIDLDLRGARADIAARLAVGSGEPPGPPRGRGRPSFGVAAREVTLLPRHWDWLAAQPGGASAALRRLVEEARRSGGGKGPRTDGAGGRLSFHGGDGGRPTGIEEAARALFAKDRQRFERHVAQWPNDVGAYARTLAEPALA